MNTKPVIAQKSIKQYQKVLFGSPVSRPYYPYTLLSDVIITTRDTRTSGNITFDITGTLPDGRQVSVQGYAYKKGRSPWKFSNKGLCPLEFHGGMVDQAEDLIHFLFEPGEWDRCYPYRFPQSLVESPDWESRQIWQEW